MVISRVRKVSEARGAEKCGTARRKCELSGHCFVGERVRRRKLDEIRLVQPLAHR